MELSFFRPITSNVVEEKEELRAARGHVAGARARLRGVQVYRGRLITTWSTWKVCKHTMLSS